MRLWKKERLQTLYRKVLFIPRKTTSKNLQNRIKKFATYEPDQKGYVISCPLIAQLGKNYSAGYDALISGDELLKMACDQVRKAQLMLSGKTAYVECDDSERLIEFYESNGFKRIGNRYLGRDRKGPDRGRSRRDGLRHDNGPVRQIERDRHRQGPSRRRTRRRTGEPHLADRAVPRARQGYHRRWPPLPRRHRLQNRRDRHGKRRLLPLPRLRRDGREVRHQGDRPARRLDERPALDRRRQQARHRDGLHRHQTFQALSTADKIV